MKDKSSDMPDKAFVAKQNTFILKSVQTARLLDKIDDVLATYESLAHKLNGVKDLGDALGDMGVLTTCAQAEHELNAETCTLAAIKSLRRKIFTDHAEMQSQYAMLPFHIEILRYMKERKEQWHACSKITAALNTPTSTLARQRTQKYLDDLAALGLVEANANEQYSLTTEGRLTQVVSR